MASGSLSAAEDVDYYVLNAAEAGVLTLNIDVPGTSSSVGYLVSVEDNAGTVLSSWRATQDSTYFLGAHYAGSYYVSIKPGWSYGYDAGNYTLSAEVAAGGDRGYEGENNDTSATADSATLSATINGQLLATIGSFQTTSDTDYFKTTLSAPSVLTVEFDSAYAANYVYIPYYAISIYDDNGTLLASRQTGADIDLSVGASNAGNYYVSISSESYVRLDPYAFVLTATAGGESGYESEGNDTRATADVVLLGNSINGQLSSKTDVDYYQVAMTSAGIITASLGGENTVQDSMVLSIYASDGTTLAARSGSGTNTLDAAVSTPGTYYVAVNAGLIHQDGFDLSYSLGVSAVSDVSPGVETEDNNTFSIADLAAIGTAMSGQLHSPTDIDTYRYSFALSGTATISFDVPDYFFSALTFSVFDSSGKLIYLKGEGNDTSFEISIQGAGDYYVVVSTNSYDTFWNAGTYAVTTSFVAENVTALETESNDTIANAESLALGTPISGQVSSASDIDYFTVTLASPGILTADITGSGVQGYSGATGTFDVSLFDASGTLLASNPANFWLSGSISAGAQSAGTYYISVAGHGDYALTATAIAGGLDTTESETNNTMATADAVALGTPISGSRTSSSDADYFSVTLAEPGVLTIDFGWEPANPLDYYVHYNVKIFDSEGSLLV